MRSRPLLRALLIGAGVVLAALLTLAGYRSLGGDPEPVRFDPAEFVRSRPKLDAPYIATDYQVVDAMLAMAEVRPDDHVIDLGSGDGRILIAAARSHGARGLGVDIDPERVREAQANARAAGVAHRVQFRRQDLFDTRLEDADVVTLYLTREVNLRLRPRILAQMRPGTRVVSHDYDMGEWRPDQRERIGSANIYLWIVPARVSGRWTLTATGPGGERSGTLDLRQRFQEVDGELAAGGASRRIEQGRLSGRRVRFIADFGDGRRVFEGELTDGRIEPVAPDSGWQAVRAG
jgi:hypothetical protein